MHSGVVIFAIALAVLILIIYYSEELGLHPSVSLRVCVPWSQYIPRLRTGDIIVACNSGFVSSLIRIYDQSPATHTAMIIVERSGIYVYEVNYSHGTVVVSMGEFMKKQRSTKFGIVPTPRELPITVADATAKCKFDLSLGFFPLPERIYCTTLVHRLQAQHGIEPWDKSCEHKTTPRTYYSDPSIVFVDYEK